MKKKKREGISRDPPSIDKDFLLKVVGGGGGGGFNIHENGLLELDLLPIDDKTGRFPTRRDPCIAVLH